MPTANRNRGEYPENWKAIARQVKDEEDWKCERCRKRHNPRTGHTLTVHHLDRDKSNCARWNLAALCQRCHLKIQNTINMDQFVFGFRVSPWFQKHYDGWLEATQNES